LGMAARTQKQDNINNELPWKLKISYCKDEAILILGARINVTVIHNSLQKQQQQYWSLTLWGLKAHKFILPNIPL
jgi:hypothetical protein